MINTPRVLATAAALTAMALLPVSTADAGALRFPGAQGAYSHREVLPPLSNPRPFRQAVFGDCNGLCLFLFDKVPAGSVLEADTVTCSVDNASDIGGVIYRSGTPDAKTAIAVFPISNLSALASGPFYFMAGDRPTIETAGAAGNQEFCSMMGTLWSTP